jgi:hypothetical protein
MEWLTSTMKDQQTTLAMMDQRAIFSRRFSTITKEKRERHRYDARGPVEPVIMIVRIST